MRIVCTILLMLAVFTKPHQDTTGLSTREFTLDLTANVSRVNSSQWDFANHSATVMRTDAIPIVAIRKTNISNQEILTFPLPTMPYDWTVSNSSGNTLAPRTVASRHCWITTGGPGFRKGSNDMFLQPGKSIVDVNRLMGVGHPMSGVKDSCRSGFDMSQPGVYTVQVGQHISNDPSSPEIRSNTITIKVLPAESAQH